MWRNPIRGETDAFRITIAAAGLGLLGFLVGSLTVAWGGAVAFAVAAIAMVALYLSRPDTGRRKPLLEAARGPHPLAGPRGRRHVLVIANAPLAGARLANEIRGAARGTAEVELDVLAPVLVSRTHLAVTDIDEETRSARRRLASSLDWAKAEGFLAHGAIGDPAPATGIEDVLRTYGADEVFVVTAGSSESWQQREELQRVLDELDVPVVQIAAEAS